MKPPILPTVVAAILLCTGLAAGASKPAMALQSSPCFAEPAADQLPLRYLDKKDTCRIDSFWVDTTGRAWYRVSASGRDLGWTYAQGLRLIAQAGVDELVSETGGATDVDKKRRYDLVRQNPGWPRRVIKAVRAGQICLDMTGAQLAASWGEPVQKSTAFTTGIGEHDMWFYKGSSGEILAVSLEEDRVIGWVKKR
jgi:hypothetical protein